MVSFHFVDVANIQSNVPRSHFLETELDRLADLILESGGLLNPLIIKQVNVDNYLVIEGDFEYYAAVKAKEKDRDRGEMVNAFLIPQKLEDVVKKQAQFFNKLNHQPAANIDNYAKNESRLSNLELRFEKQINDIKAEYGQQLRELQYRIKEVENLISAEKDALTLLNQLDQKEIAIKLQRSRISGAESKAKNIFEARRKKNNQKFEDYRDVVKSVRGLGEKTILTIIDEWSR